MSRPKLTDREQQVYDLLGKDEVSARDLIGKVSFEIANIRGQLISLGKKGYAKKAKIQKRVKLFGQIRTQPTVGWTKR